MHPSELEELKKGGVVKLKGKDMFSVWVKAVCDNMDAVKLRKVAEIAEKYAKGVILFTSRQFPIIPFVQLNDIQTAKDELEKVNLVLDRCGARVRNGDVCYDSKLCEYAVLNPIDLGGKLDSFWTNDRGGFKIKTSIAGCERQCTSPQVLADLGFVAREEKDVKGYDVYLGGKLGLEPFVGLNIAKLLSEEQCVALVENYVNFIRKEGKPGERSANLIRRLGAETVKAAVTKDLDKAVKLTVRECDTKQSKTADKEHTIARFKAINGELTSAQVKVLADIAEKHGLGFIHFSVRGGPEVPGIKKSELSGILKDAADKGLEFLDRGVDNIQSCFGRYCTNGGFDVQDLLCKVDKLVEKVGLSDLNIKISGSGCPNSCGISLLSDIGYSGVVLPVVVSEKCNGCGICPKACVVKAIDMADGKAIINEERCRNCDFCVKSCPFDAIVEKKRGIAVYAGGVGPHFKDDNYPGGVKLAEKVADFIDEAEALRITEVLLKIIKEKNKNMRTIMDEEGVDTIKTAIQAQKGRSL